MIDREGVTRTIESIPVGLLSYDDTINRETVKSKVDSIRGNFDPALVGVLCVSRRTNGDLIVLDGQHRAIAIRTHPDLGDDYEVECELYSGLTYEDEANMITQRNTQRTAMRPFDLFRAGVQGNNPLYRSMDKVLADLGLRAGKSASKESVACIKAMERVMRDFGPDNLRDSLQVLIDAYGREPESYDADMVQAVSVLLGRNELDSKSRDRLVTKIARDGREVMTPERWKRRAIRESGFGGSRTRSIAVAEQIAGAYNYRLADGKKIRW